MKYVIRSGFNTFVPDTKNWDTDAWTESLDEAKVFDSFDKAVAGLNQVADWFKQMGWGCSSHTIHEVHEVKSLSLGDATYIDDKKTVLSLLEAITKYGVESRDVPDMNRITNYVKAKGT